MIKVSDSGRHKRNCLPVMVKDFGIKGRGLVASKSFMKGDLILTDETVVSYQEDEDFEELMKHVDRLDVDDRKDYFNLVPKKLDLENISKDLYSPSEMDAYGIYDNNNISGDVCLTLSLLNHSCDPNSLWCR